MSDHKYYPYSFYVPIKDEALCKFIESQSNLSMSIRLLIKAFIANYGDNDEYPDITVMDLRELINAVGIPQNAVAGKAIKTEKKTEKVVKHDEQVVDLSTQEENTQPEITEAVAEEAVEKTSEEDNTAEENFEEDNTAEENFEEDNSEEENFEEENSEEDNTAEENSEEDADDMTPTVIVEPENPQKTINSGREAYNKAQDAADVVTDDDLLAMMGNM